MVYKTLPASEVPVPMREPFILTGYRLLHQPWTYYVISLLKWHNETLAVWSHLLSAILIILQTLYYGQTYDLLSNEDGKKILMFSIGCVSMTSLSAFAHLMHSKSVKYHYVFFLFDYSGIALYAYSTAVGSLYICSEPYIFSVLEHYYIPVTVVLGTVTFLLTVIAKLKVTNPFSWQRKCLMIVPYVIYAVWVSTPIIFRYRRCFYDNGCSLTSLNHISLVYCLFILTAAVYSTHLPEKWRPGNYDNIGQSHQTFHYCSLATIVMQLVAIRIDIEQGQSQHSVFNFRSGLMGFIIFFNINTLIIIYYLPLIVSNSQKFEQFMRNNIMRNNQMRNNHSYQKKKR
ncbi:membrane progestin receptor beta [Patella vulgata]|uniref:membrane progestin receptor beta n=1 Tax=Patella vulgata TaxID=6465 RepID=UPI00217FCE61|nr:membrane progestin receptor beta [Patella vulgata]XP_050411804.1 membrane progestin receptor beta [Patella vulgata]XP_050411805.1 membrane progestin receptor beta [Patella vulgata]